jgi:hypothetical protein
MPQFFADRRIAGATVMGFATVFVAGPVMTHFYPLAGCMAENKRQQQAADDLAQSDEAANATLGSSAAKASLRDAGRAVSARPFGRGRP